MTSSLCDRDYIVQNGARCFLVSPSLVITKSPKLLKYISPEDLRFLNRIQDVRKGDACPMPPASLQRRYDYYRGMSNDGLRLDTEFGYTDAVLKAFLSKESRAGQNPIIVDKFYEENYILSHNRVWARLPRVLRKRRMLLNDLVHKHTLVIVPLELSKKAGIGSAFGRTLQAICSTNDHIVGGFMCLRRKLSVYEKRNHTDPNPYWSKEKLRTYIRDQNQNIPVRRRIRLDGTKAELIHRIQASNTLSRNFRDLDDEMIGHAVGFTVCHDSDTNSTIRTAKVTMVICNWDVCHKGNNEFQVFRDKLLKKQLPKKDRPPPYAIYSLNLVLA